VLAFPADPPDQPLTFHGYADPTVVHDPLVPGRLWLAYTHLDPGSVPSLDGGTLIQGACSTHLAFSVDGGGTSWTFDKVLWPAFTVADPDQPAATTYENSEVASLAVVRDGGQVTWYGEHLRYVQQPVAGYDPDFAGSWTIRVAAVEADTPEALADAGESVLALASVDAGTWGVTTILEDISPAGSISDCYFFNNPAITVVDGTLYLAAECWVPGSGDVQDATLARVVLYATTPTGPAPTWVWHYVGVLADHDMAVALGGVTLDEPDFSRAADGTLLLTLSPTVVGGPTGSLNIGCLSLAMTSLDPPTYATACDGGFDVRAELVDAGACTYDARSATGLIGVARLNGEADLELVGTGLLP
jgi:hypothetical protein